MEMDKGNLKFLDFNKSPGTMPTKTIREKETRVLHLLLATQVKFCQSFHRAVKNVRQIVTLIFSLKQSQVSKKEQEDCEESLIRKEGEKNTDKNINTYLDSTGNSISIT